MEQRNNKQDRIIFEVEELLNKMSNQVNFLIRKEITMNQLDLDLLMENTRKLYDRLCSVELGVGAENLGIEDEDESDNSDTDVENTDADFGNSVIDTDLDVDLNFEEDEVEEEVFGIEDLGVEGEDVEEDEEEDVDMVWDFTRDDDVDADSEVDTDIDSDSDTDFENADTDFEDTDLNIDEGNDEENMIVEEEVEEEEMIIENEVVDEVSATEEELSADSLADNPIELKKEEPKKEEDSGIRAYRIVRDNVHTIGDILEKTEDNSLAARLQRKPVSDLISAIGINDKFLFLNELFNGSMEKYNKSIRSLNSFSTLLGAKTYMSELQIEFQWDCNSDAYKKLNDLIERRFL